MPTFQKPPTVNEDERAQDIYRLAAEVIYERGFEATSMGEIADAVDLTKGGLYYYIKGKKALLYAIMSFAMELVEDEVVMPALGRPEAGDRLAGLVEGYTRLMLRETPSLWILAHENEGLDAEHLAKIQARKMRFSEVLSDAIGEVLGKRGRRRIDPVVAAHGILGMVHGIDRWYSQSDGNLTDDEVVAQLTGLALRGLTPE